VVGRRPVEEALAAGRAIEVLVARGARPPDCGRVPLRTVGRAALDSLSGGAVHQGVAAQVQRRPTLDLGTLLSLATSSGDPALLVVAAGVQDPRNLGAIARSAEAAGAHGLVLPSRRSAPVGPVAEKAAAGAFAHLPVAVVENLPRAVAACQQAGLWAYAADPAGELPYTAVDWRAPVALVIGGEGGGVPRLVRERCDGRVRLPMRGRLGSLNAAVAAGVLLYEVVRQRGEEI
jgi:23S rRNA (guanosine2251-2'-O)-methyltransferase